MKNALTYREIDQRASENVSITGSSADNRMSHMYGVVETLLTVDVMKYIYRPIDVNRYLVFFNNSRSALTHINYKGEIINATLEIKYCNPCSYRTGRYRKYSYNGRPNHYIEMIVTLALDTGVEIKTCVGSFKSNSRSTVIEAMANKWEYMTGEKLLEVTKSINLQTFMAIHELCKNSKYNNTTIKNVTNKMIDNLDITIEKSIEALLKAEFIVKDVKSFTKDGEIVKFETLRVTDKGMKRLESVM